MAEFILAVVGLAVAVPGVAVSFAQCGEYLTNLVSKFKNAPQAVQELGTFGHDLHQGKLKLNLELAEWAFSIDNLDVFVKDAVEESLNRLRAALSTAAATLDGFCDKKGNVRRTNFALFGDRKAKQALDGLKRWQSDFESIIDLIDKKRRLVPNDLLLDRKKLRIIHQSGGVDYESISYSPHSLAHCEYLNNGVREIKALIEHKTVTVDHDHEEVEAITSTLATKLYTNTAKQGILKCIGYRKPHNFELVFELPGNFRSAQCLAALLHEPQSTIFGGYTLQERVQLCRQICDAVLCVHTSGLVHKNIRPSAILLVQTASDPQNALGSAYLTDWFMLRKVTDLSSRRGIMDWREDIYRHPRRQGRQPEERYNIGHDIYSLGVLLVETCLWEPFVEPSQTSYISNRYVSKALELGLVKAQEADRIEKLTMPLVIAKTMVGLAEAEIPPRMGTAFASFVVACLTCLEGGIDGLTEADFKNNSTMAALKFREMVIQTFQTLPTP